MSNTASNDQPDLTPLIKKFTGQHNCFKSTYKVWMLTAGALLGSSIAFILLALLGGPLLITMKHVLMQVLNGVQSLFGHWGALPGQQSAIALFFIRIFLSIICTAFIISCLHSYLKMKDSGFRIGKHLGLLLSTIMACSAYIFYYDSEDTGYLATIDFMKLYISAPEMLFFICVGFLWIISLAPMMVTFATVIHYLAKSMNEAGEKDSSRYG